MARLVSGFIQLQAKDSAAAVQTAPVPPAPASTAGNGNGVPATRDAAADEGGKRYVPHGASPQPKKHVRVLRKMHSDETTYKGMSFHVEPALASASAGTEVASAGADATMTDPAVGFWQPPAAAGEA